ncbi:hypothetical protein N866_05750 [Actinotalea ferrariae CF5-4]|uniref:DegT/DnrJ/EryC1/StrS aminotransferase n=1 Tax=Actinotalea ferrariae CF5-4 TaxID=948458 RepID=A0A021VRN6_9CELL|nr:DegT/DnrJ/EryC1/StrS family aminotransferase [Actinotalea ferrariae]EYR62715.1 hypothetical protein N866_05750 [Actinotalea ferrariae CF5-4]
MTERTAADAVTRALAARTGTSPGDWHLVFKARYGMQVVLRAIAAERGVGDVLTQVFTCCTAVDPVLAAGLRPVYGEVSPATVALDPARLESGRLQPGASTRAVVLQHTFGIIDDAAARGLRDAADRAGALLLEDAAHCVGRMARREDGSPLADVSVHSFGVEKMLPTKFGAAVWVDPALQQTPLGRRMVQDLTTLPTMGRRLDLAARLYRTQLRVLGRLPGPAATALRRLLTRTGTFEPAIAPVEQRGGLAHPPLRPSPWVTQRMADALGTLDAEERRRSAVVARYLAALGDVVEVPAGIGASAPLVRFPFFAPDADAAQRVDTALSAAGHRPGRWYRPALFPGVTDPARYGYSPGTLATTEDLMARVVNLPTTVDTGTADRIADVVRRAIG